MDIDILKIHSIKTKSDLHDYYDMQMSVENVKTDINDIVRESRNLPAGMRNAIQKLYPKEVLLFMIEHGYPNGYLPDEEIKIKIEIVRAEIRDRKKHEWELKK